MFVNFSVCYPTRSSTLTLSHTEYLNPYRFRILLLSLLPLLLSSALRHFQSIATPKPSFSELVEFMIVAAGVRFVQIFAPFSLACVIISILSVYAGAIHKTIDPDAGPKICMLGDHLLKRSTYFPDDAASHIDPCLYCSKNTSLPLYHAFCKQNGSEISCKPLWDGNDLKCIQGMPGFLSGVIIENNQPYYMKAGESRPGIKADKEVETFQDLSTSFFKLLAIYFPSVTGIMTGSNMSGDLRDPQQSIPSGTLAAQISTSFVYLSFIVIFGGVIKGPLLLDKYGNSLGSGMVVAELCWPTKWIMLIGSFTSTFGAALQCICSAPRLLQSIAKDNVIPVLSPFSVVTRWNEPFRGLIISSVIAALAILIGAVDYIAPIVELFFLMCYAFVNMVCALHSLLGAPNWRPRFKYYHWTFSLLGAALCFFIMFATYWYYALIALVLCLLIYKYVEYKGAKKEWGDGIRGLALTTAQYSLAKIEDKDPHPKNWRPQILLLMKLNADNRKMFELASHLKAGKGLTLVASMMEGDPTKATDRRRSEDLLDNLKAEMKESKLKGFAKTIIYEDKSLGSSVSTLIQSAGIGGLKPNTVLVGWPSLWKEADNDENYWEFMDAVHRGASLDMCLIVPKGVKNFPSRNDRLMGFIDVWWILHDGGLLILLSFLLQQHKVWRGCRLRLFAVAQQKDNSIKMKEDMEKFLYQLRINGTVHIVEFADPEISAYAYERTLMMEERSKLLQNLHLSDKEKRQLPQLLVEKHRGSSSKTLSEMTDGTPLVGKAPLSEKETEFTTPPTSPTSPSENSLRVPGADASNRLSGFQSGDESDGMSDQEDLTSEERDRVMSLKKRPATDSGKAATSEKSDKSYQYTFTPQEGKKLAKIVVTGADEDAEGSRAERIRKLDRRKVKKMHTAVRLNEKIREYSESGGESQLVVLNLPRPPHSRVGLHNYMEYLEALTDKLDRVLLVRGSGKEVITVFS